MTSTEQEVDTRPVLCFGVGIGNFATGREHTTPKLVASITEALRSSGGEVVAAFGSTGNLAVGLPTDDLAWLQRTLQSATGRLWAVVRQDLIANSLSQLGAWDSPSATPGVRWTKGLALAVGPSVSLEAVADDELGLLRLLHQGVVGVQKQDYLTERGTLDSARRRGCWGAISAAVARQLGGTWTARSDRTIWGLLSRTATS